MESEQSIVPTLQILSGPLAGRLFKIDRDLMIIGRNPDCDLVLEPKSVSRRHAAIVRARRDYVIKDLGSTRGTFVNGLRLTQPVVLKNGCVIQIGELQLVVQDPGGPDPGGRRGSVDGLRGHRHDDARATGSIRWSSRKRSCGRSRRSCRRSAPRWC